MCCASLQPTISAWTWSPPVSLSISTYNYFPLCRCYDCESSSSSNARLFYFHTNCTFLSDSTKCLKRKCFHLHLHLNAFPDVKSISAVDTFFCFVWLKHNAFSSIFFLNLRTDTQSGTILARCDSFFKGLNICLIESLEIKLSGHFMEDLSFSAYSCECRWTVSVIIFMN